MLKAVAMKAMKAQGAAPDLLKVVAMKAMKARAAAPVEAVAVKAMYISDTNLIFRLASEPETKKKQCVLRHRFI